MKVKVFQYYHYDYEEDVEKEVNDFIKDKEVIDIKQTSTMDFESYDNTQNRFVQLLIMYKEEKNEERRS